MSLHPEDVAASMAEHGWSERRVADTFALILGVPPLSDEELAALGPMPHVEDHEHAMDLQWRHADIALQTDLWDSVQDAISDARYEDDPRVEPEVER